MSAFEKFRRSDFFIKLTNWEYWPFGIIQFPVFFYYLWLSLRARSLLFFSASNPGITMGGLVGESKFDIIKKIPSEYIPRTILIKLPATTQSIFEVIQKEGFVFPVIFKPELGERGFMVKKIESANDIGSYLQKIKINFLVQEFVDLPLEFGILYMRLPFNENGSVISVVKKEMLTVTGDGLSTLKQLILNKDRAKLQWKRLKEAYATSLGKVIPAGQTVEIVSIGNHAMGTKFLDGKEIINKKLSFTFDKISKQIEGFYFGRFDIRCATLEDLYEGNIKILELNGCGAEPAHIYDPDFLLTDAIVVLFKHWKMIFEIARQNHKLGVKYISLKEGAGYYKKFKKATG